VDRIPGHLFTAAITDAGILSPGDVGREAVRRYGDLIAAPG
jgi:hypothetical protein